MPYWARGAARARRANSGHRVVESGNIVFSCHSNVSGGYVGELSIPPHWGAAAADLAREQGWDAAEILVGAQVSPRILTGEPTTVSVEQLRTVAQAVMSRSHDESFGVSESPLPVGTAQMLLFSLATSGTVSAAFARWSILQAAIPAVPKTSVARSRDLATVSIDVSTLQFPDIAVAEWILGLAVRTMSWATMRRIQIEKVRFPHKRPAGYSDYHRLFHSPVEYDCTALDFVVSAHHLDTPILRTEEEITTLLARPEEILFAAGDYRQLLPEQIRRIIDAGLGNHVPAVAEIATALSMTPSALQRTLRTEFGTSVREIRDATLRDEAIKSLADGAESLTELSSRLGFSEVSAFTRAFRRWTGVSPAQYRDGARSVK